LKATSVNIYDLEGKSTRKSIDLPSIFNTPFRPDVIRRAVVAIDTHKLQPQGRNPMAGKRTTAESLGVGRGLSRVPRVKGERYEKAGSAAFAPNTVGGRLTHPPRVEKNIKKKINKKEKKMALTSAIAATASKEIVSKRGHRIEKLRSFPLIVNDDLQELKKTSEVKDALSKLGAWLDVERVLGSIKVRSKGKSARGKAKSHSVGPLIVVAENKGVIKAANNIAGVEAVEVNSLNVSLLAPGTHPGRLTIWTESAIKHLENLTI
jgi:large subunit ribosomal protein L4e